MTAPTTNFLEGLRELSKPPRCHTGETFDKHLTPEEITEFEAAARAGLTNLAALRRYFNQHTGEALGKDTFSRHMRGECSCE